MLKRDSHQDRDVYVQEHIWGEAFEHLAVGIAQVSMDAILLNANEHLCELIGLSKRELLQKQLAEFFMPEGSWGVCKAGLDSLLAGEIPHYSTNMSAVRADRNPIWVHTVFSLVRDNETKMPQGLTAVMTDITLLKQTMRGLHDAEVMRDELSRRMTNTQEAERTRIARELHDDVGQSLAVLKIQMLRAGQPVSGHPERVHASLKQLTLKLDKIIDKLNHLSHDLHSSELELLGLAVAVKSHCRECSEQLGISIDCSCDQVEGKLDSIVALAFLRVLQEGLHNAVKHSRATSITVRLTDSNRELGLEISDNGVGFEIESARLAA